eukprot:TRINITY_DN4295_c0_g1_i1.p3 TRINITY_DN4295_c0_g1~~TRINITY_DN4295_c0_g1_i1.p3  ORF type:complete len:100 (+),score=0.61 TRINITY_DN4295_c0_g1_i1:45-302(+)
MYQLTSQSRAIIKNLIFHPLRKLFGVFEANIIYFLDSSKNTQYLNLEIGVGRLQVPCILCKNLFQCVVLGNVINYQEAFDGLGLI